MTHSFPTLRFSDLGDQQDRKQVHRLLPGDGRVQPAFASLPLVASSDFRLPSSDLPSPSASSAAAPSSRALARLTSGAASLLLPAASARHLPFLAAATATFRS